MKKMSFIFSAVIFFTALFILGCDNKKDSLHNGVQGLGESKYPIVFTNIKKVEKPLSIPVGEENFYLITNFIKKFGKKDSNCYQYQIVDEAGYKHSFTTVSYKKNSPENIYMVKVQVTKDDEIFSYKIDEINLSPVPDGICNNHEKILRGYNCILAKAMGK